MCVCVGGREEDCISSVTDDQTLHFADIGHIGAAITAAKEWAGPGGGPAGALQY